MTEPKIGKQIEDFAKLQFTDSEIATIVEMSRADLVKQHRRDIDRGRLLAEAEVRTAMLKLAKEGNATALKSILEMNRNAKRSTRAEAR